MGPEKKLALATYEAIERQADVVRHKAWPLAVEIRDAEAERADKIFEAAIEQPEVVYEAAIKQIDATFASAIAQAQAAGDAEAEAQAWAIRRAEELEAEGQRAAVTNVAETTYSTAIAQAQATLDAAGKAARAVYDKVRAEALAAYKAVPEDK